MKHNVSYRMRIPRSFEENGGLTRDAEKALEATVAVYRSALSFLIKVVNTHWECLELLKGNTKNSGVERLVHATKEHPEPAYPEFDELFHEKMPSYFRRAVIADALGVVASYKANLENWEKAKIGNAPTLSFEHFSFPTFYKPSMFIYFAGEYACKVKVYNNEKWEWMEFPLKKGDVDYVLAHCQDRKMSNPTLERKGKTWLLRFLFSTDVELTTSDVFEQRICAVDLGINTYATCSIMEADGTIIGRKFIDVPIEKDRLNKALGRIKKAQQKGARKTSRLWALANNINKAISQKVARQIVDFAALYSCDVLVFEHLDILGKIKGSKKQRIALWRKREIQRICESQGHLLGMRYSTINAWNTSRLAFDGSGRVLRGKDIPEEYGSFNNQTCMFTTGKFYNCDLNASYNIGARYFVREILKSLPETERLALEAKVPSVAKRTTSTLSSLISLNVELSAKLAA